MKNLILFVAILILVTIACSSSDETGADETPEVQAEAVQATVAVTPCPDGLRFTNDILGESPNLSCTLLPNASLQNADLTGADLEGANLIYAHLDDANLCIFDCTVKR